MALAMPARKTKKTKTAPATDSIQTNEERRAGADRRDNAVDRRAFWRPTPDRRREERELGRRSTDVPATDPA